MAGLIETCPVIAALEALWRVGDQAFVTDDTLRHFYVLNGLALCDKVSILPSTAGVDMMWLLDSTHCSLTVFGNHVSSQWFSTRTLCPTDSRGRLLLFLLQALMLIFDLNVDICCIRL